MTTEENELGSNEDLAIYRTRSNSCGADAARLTDAKALAQALEQACDPPCVPRPMLGMSDWKNLGFNTVCKCVVALHRAGFRHRSEYIHDGIWPTEENYELIIRKGD